jgi:predicted transposase YbfD/YdcC
MVLRGVDREALDAKLGAWAEGRLTATPASQDAWAGLAIDGQTLRGSQKQGAPGAHLRSAVGHRLGLTLAHHAVADKTKEMPVVMELLRQVGREGRVVTREALRTQRAMAPQIVEAGGDSVLVVKANQPQWREDIAPVCALPPLAAETRTVAQTVDGGHGRIEPRRLEPRDGLVGSSDWPGLAPVLQLERQVVSTKTGEGREAVVAGVTSLAPERADAARLLALVRGHWPIENPSHGVREVTFEEERSPVRCGNLPQVLAALRKTVIGLTRGAGETNMAAACRRFAAPPAFALELLGIQLENWMALAPWFQMTTR